MRNGQPVDRVSIEEIIFETRGVEVNLLWDATADDLMIPLPANEVGHLDYRNTGPLKNPESTGVTGKINLSTFNPATTGATSAFSIRLVMRKHT